MTKIMVTIGLILAFFLVFMPNPEYKVRKSLVKITGVQGWECTGFEIKAPSGKHYILTAGHCVELFRDEIHARAENELTGKVKDLEIVKVDEQLDVMLLTSAGLPALDVAKIDFRHERVMSVSHGANHDAYKSEGELLEEGDAPIMDPFGFVERVMHVEYSNVQVTQGSSGAPVVDYDGNVVGLVSIMNRDQLISGLVPLKTIQLFLQRM